MITVFADSAPLVLKGNGAIPSCPSVTNTELLFGATAIFVTERLVVSAPEGNAIDTGEPVISESVPSELMAYSPTAAAPLASPATSRNLPDGSTVSASGATSCARTLLLMSVGTPVPLLMLEPKIPVPATPTYRNVLF